MAPRQLFGVVVRSMGLFVGLYAIAGLFYVVASRALTQPVAHESYYLAWCITAFAVAVFLMLGADLVVGLAYFASCEGPQSTVNVASKDDAL